MIFSDIPEDVQEEMFDDWLWEKYYSELYSKAIKQVEKELGFWKSIRPGTKQKIRDRQWKLFEELKNDVLTRKHDG